MSTFMKVVELYKPNKKAEGEQKFVAKHVAVKKDDPAGNKDDVYQATNVKKASEQKYKHGYDSPEDEKVYESAVKSGSKKHRREKEDDRDDDYEDDDYEEDRRMKEDRDQIDELKKSTIGSYINKVVDPVYGVPRSPKKIKQRLAGLSRAHQRVVGHKPVTKEEAELDEAQMSKPEMKERERLVKGMKKNLASFRSRYGKDAKAVMYATATKKAMEENVEGVDEQLKGKQHKLDKNKNGKLDAHDFKLLRKEDLNDDELYDVIEAMFENLTDEGRDYVNGLIENEADEELAAFLDEYLEGLEEIDQGEEE